MKLCVISDTHASSMQQVSPAVVSALQDSDLIIHAGDFCYLQVYQELCRLGDVRAVYGNNDSAEVRRLLPDTQLLEIGGKKIGLVHGWGAAWGMEQKILRKFSNVDMVIYGHTHKPRNEMVQGVCLFNPGSASRSYGIIEIDTEIRGCIVQLY